MKKIILGLAIVLGLSFCAVSGVDATETESSVFQYQETTISPVNIGAENLSYGMRSEVIRELQQILSRDLSIYPEKLTTGYFGLLTQKAVKRFQEKRGILQTGIVNKYLKELIWNWDVIPESIIAVPPTFLPTGSTECNKQCSFKGYSNGTCRMSCHTDEVNISKCHMPCPIPEGEGGCATVEYYCCCGNKDGGDSGKCTDSDGGINKYVKGTACQPSRKISISNEDFVSGSASLFCETDRCIDEVSTGPIPSGTERTKSFVLEYYCRNGVMMSKQIECVKGCQDGACASGPHPVDPEDCIGNGEVYKDWSGLQGRCCEGLHVIASGYRNNISYCTSEVCGNGECQALENEWNCKKDCKTTTQPVNVQPIINMIKQAIEKLNLAIRMLGDLVAISVDSDGGTSSSSGGGGGTSSGE